MIFCFCFCFCCFFVVSDFLRVALERPHMSRVLTLETFCQTENLRLRLPFVHMLRLNCTTKDWEHLTRLLVFWCVFVCAAFFGCFCFIELSKNKKNDWKKNKKATTLKMCLKTNSEILSLKQFWHQLFITQHTDQNSEDCQNHDKYQKNKRDCDVNVWADFIQNEIYQRFQHQFEFVLYIISLQDI